MDRTGKFSALRETPGGYLKPAFSPDGKRLALVVNDGKRLDIWVDEWEHDALTRLTFAGEAISDPIWTPDGQRIVYSLREKGGAFNLLGTRDDGGGDQELLTESKKPQGEGSKPPEGKVLAFFQNNPGPQFDVMTRSIE